MRWPVVLKQKPLESLSSWLERHAKYYRVQMNELFTSGLNMNPVKNLLEIDFLKINNLFSNISNKTGVLETELYHMTLPSLSPRVFDFFDVYSRKELENYSNSFGIFYWLKYSDLVSRSEKDIKINVIPWVRETVWSAKNKIDRYCHICHEENDGYRILPWRLCILSTCPKHKCFLVEKHLIYEYSSSEIKNTTPQKELLWLDEMTLDALKYGQVVFSNGDKMCDMVWYRFLRGFVKQIPIIRNKYQKKLDKDHDLLYNKFFEVEHKIQFESLQQEKRIFLMTTVAKMLYKFPENIFSKIHLEWHHQIPFCLKNKIPYSLASNIDITRKDSEIFDCNKDFSIKSGMMRNEGLSTEIKNDLISNHESRESMLRLLTYNGRISQKEARNIIAEMCNKKTSYFWSDVFNEIAESPTLQTRLKNSPLIEEQDHHDLPVCNEQSC
jgi:hypothetical protein